MELETLWRQLVERLSPEGLVALGGALATILAGTYRLGRRACRALGPSPPSELCGVILAELDRAPVAVDVKTVRAGKVTVTSDKSFADPYGGLFWVRCERSSNNLAEALDAREHALVIRAARAAYHRARRAESEGRRQQALALLTGDG